MFTIKYARPSPDGRRVLLGLERDGEALKLSVSKQTYSSIGEPMQGEELREEELAEARLSDGEYRAMKKALSLLSFADNNRKNLYLKLLRLGFEKQISAQTVRECVRLGYIDERRQLCRLVAEEANRKLHGPRLIRPRLYSKGYSAADIDLVIETLVASGEVDFLSNFDFLCKKHSADTEEERLALRYKYGYGTEVN